MEEKFSIPQMIELRARASGLSVDLYADVISQNNAQETTRAVRANKLGSNVHFVALVDALLLSEDCLHIEERTLAQV